MYAMNRKEYNHRAYEKRKEKKKRMCEQLREQMSTSRRPMHPDQQTIGEIDITDEITSIDLSRPLDEGYDQYEPP